MSTLSNVIVSALSGAAAAGAVTAVNFVTLQAASPGAPDTGHINVTGNIIGGRIGAGVPPGLAKVQVNETGALQGVRSTTASGVSVFGQNTAASGLGAGGYFTSASVGGRALVAEQLSTTGNTVGGLFYNRSTTGGVAVWGKHIGTSGTTYGVYGESASADGFGVYGTNTNADGVAVRAVANSSNSGKATILADNDLASGGWGRAAHLRGGAESGDGMFVECDQTTQDFSYAIKGTSAGANGRGLYAFCTESSGTNYGVFGQTSSSTNGYGVFSSGNTGASGTKSMVIDNPLDPANSILKQYCAEGAEPLMVYSGTIKLNANGAATVGLPTYFNSIAKNPRYSLTAVGSSMPNLYVSERMSGNMFRVAGGTAYGEVSWTVYATRNDPWVKANGAPTVIAKPAQERGHYIAPQLYGAKPSQEYQLQPAERQARLQKEANEVRRPH